MKLLVNAPSGDIEIVEVGEGGGYFDRSRVLHDERTGGPIGNTIAPLTGDGEIAKITGITGGALVWEVVAAPIVVPKEVTMRQARQALILAGLDDDVEAAINAIPGIQGKLARAEWDQSQTVQRDRPLVVQLGTALGLDLDQLFIAAAKL